MFPVMFAVAWRLLHDSRAFLSTRWPILARLASCCDHRCELIPVRAWQETVRFSSQPISGQADPFTHRKVGQFEAFNAGRREPKDRRSGGAPIDWISLHLKSRLPEQADRARHMKGRCYQQPALACLWIGDRLGEFRILNRVAREPLGCKPILRHAE